VPVTVITAVPVHAATRARGTSSETAPLTASAPVIVVMGASKVIAAEA
jgi:hypothetical protein